MKRLLFAAGGAAIGLLAAFLVAWTIGQMWGPLYSSEDDMARNVRLFLVASLAAVILGAWIAVRIHARSRRIR